MSLFKIDGKSYNVYVPVGGMQRNFEVYASRREQLINGGRVFDVIGTFYSYSVVVDTSNATEAEYDELFDIISSPEEWHEFEFPYGQTVLTFRGHIDSGGDTMYKRQGGRNSWGDLQFAVVATKPQRRAL